MRKKLRKKVRIGKRTRRGQNYTGYYAIGAMVFLVMLLMVLFEINKNLK